jgi:hypothetical protein
MLNEEAVVFNARTEGGPPTSLFHSVATNFAQYTAKSNQNTIRRTISIPPTLYMEVSYSQ